MGMFKNQKQKFGLRTVLACAESTSAKCSPAQSLTLRSVGQFRIFENLTFRLRAALAYADSYISQISPRKRIFKRYQFNLFIAQMGSIHERKNAKTLLTLPLPTRFLAAGV